MPKTFPSKEARTALNLFKEDLAKELNISFSDSSMDDEITIKKADQDAAKITSNTMKNLFNSTYKNNENSKIE
jgi:hypothetical protein